MLGTLQELGIQGESLHKSLFVGLQFQREASFILIGDASLTQAYEVGLLALGIHKKRIARFESVEATPLTLKFNEGTFF